MTDLQQELSGVELIEHEGRMIYVPRLSNGEYYGTEWRSRPYRVDEQMWMSIGAIVLDMTAPPPEPRRAP